MRALVRTLVAAALASSALAGAAHAATPQEEANKKVAVAFYKALLNDKDWDAVLKLVGPTYRQHNPAAVDGIEGIKAHQDMLKARFPQNEGHIKRVFVDGDIVIIHVNSIRTPGTRGNAIVDILRVEKGKVVEHWDVVQPVPDPATAANRNGMF